MGKKIGITSTIPVEVVLAAGDVPVDLNNVFINDPDPARFIRYAEDAGYPRNICCWIKGLFGLVMQTRCADAVIALGRSRLVACGTRTWRSNPRSRSSKSKLPSIFPGT